MKLRFRRKHGSFMTEFGAVLMLGLPILLLFAYATVETCFYFTIKANLETSCRSCARQIAIDYIKNGNTTGFVNAGYLSQFFIPGYVTSATQFNTQFLPAGAPTTVQVTTTLPPGGGGGRLTFPNPDVFNLGPSFNLSTAWTATLEGQ
jgi:hypothetical protein